MLVFEKKKKIMGGAEVTRYRIHLFLENKKQNTFASKKNIESTRVLKFRRRKIIKQKKNY